jgi:hypothetical protein
MKAFTNLIEEKVNAASLALEDFISKYEKQGTILIS